MTRLLVLRPEPGASATVAAARAIGRDAITAPLFVLRSIDWAAPDPLPPAILLTSANAARHGGARLEALRALPVYAVGAATAAAARDAGFATVTVGDDGIDAVLVRARRGGVATLLHLAGREHHPPADPAMTVIRRIVYAADAVDRLPDTARAVLPDAVALLHSARAAATFARLIDEAGIARGSIRLAAISAAALDGAGNGWRGGIVADMPDDAALLAAAVKLCDQ